MADSSEHDNKPAKERAATELEKVKLEVDLLKREKNWFWTLVKLPLFTTLVAAGGVLATVWQFQKAELAQIEERRTRTENEIQERVSRIQSQIRADKQQLTEFESDPKISSLQASFLIDDLRSLVRQLPERESEEEAAIAEDLRRIAWTLRFDERRHFEFDVSALSRWNALREYWQSNPPSHHLFLTRKYYPRIEKLRSCFEQLIVEGETIDYRKMDKTCDEELVGAVIYGFSEHLHVAKETSGIELFKETEDFVSRSNNRSLGDELLRQARLRRYSGPP